MCKNYMDLLFPDRDKLIKKDGVITATIIDAELDPIPLTFDGDGDFFTIETHELQYVTLTEENLRTMLKLLKESRR